MPQSREPLRGLGGPTRRTLKLLRLSLGNLPSEVRRQVPVVLSRLMEKEGASDDTLLKCCQTVQQIDARDQKTLLEMARIELELAKQCEPPPAATPPAAEPAPPKREKTDEEKRAAIRAALGDWPRKNGQQ